MTERTILVYALLFLFLVAAVTFLLAVAYSFVMDRIDRRREAWKRYLDLDE